jgi:hypothetical protein
MLGAGVEQAILPRWTVKAEYAFLSFDNASFTAPASVAGELLTPTSAAGTHVSQDIHQFKIGLNYRLDGGNASAAESARQLAGESGWANGTQYKAGVRYVHGWARFQKDLGIMGLGVASPASRLTYESPGLDGAEGFARIDTSSGLMVKGLVGRATGGGHMNDEDWGLPFALFIPYSNTISGRRPHHVLDGRCRIQSLARPDLYDRAVRRLQPVRQDMKGLGCTQIANPASDCNPAIPRTCWPSPRMTPGMRCGSELPSMSRSRRASRCPARPLICPT